MAHSTPCSLFSDFDLGFAFDLLDDFLSLLGFFLSLAGFFFAEEGADFAEEGLADPGLVARWSSAKRDRLKEKLCSQMHIRHVVTWQIVNSSTTLKIGKYKTMDHNVDMHCMCLGCF